MEHANFLQPILILLFSGILGVAFVQRFKLSPILGYFLAGILVGPFGLKLVNDSEAIHTIAEITAKWATVQLLGAAGAAGVFGGPVGAIVGSLAGGVLGGLFGGGHHRAEGGNVVAGEGYIVGEKRPEFFVPRVSGAILPRVPSSSSSSYRGVRWSER